MSANFRLTNQASRWWRIAAGVVILMGVIGVALAQTASRAYAQGTMYIFATFRGNAAADEKLWIYTSTDATNFTLYSNTGYGGPTGVLRDPTIMKHTDGKYYIAFTTQSFTTASTSFAVASSTNLINWTTIATVPSGVANTHFTWAPEWYIEGGTVRLIVSVDDSGNGSAFRTFAYTAQNSALTSWSGPTYIGIAGNMIDTFIVKSGSTYHAYSKGPTWIEHATASSITGPWTWVGTGNWAGWGSGIEGPALVQLDNGTWRFYADNFGGSGGIKTSTSSNLTSWSSLVNIGTSGLRHGTILRDTSFAGTTPMYYRITNRNSSKVIDVQNPNTANNAKIGQYAWNGNNWQQWQFVDVGGGYFNIISRNSGKCMDVTSVSTADGAGIIQYTCGSGQNQQFQWAAIGSYFQIKARHSGKCINVVGSSTADGALLEQRTCSSTNNAMQWTRQ